MLLILILQLLGMQAWAGEPVRVESSINSGWTFIQGNPEEAMQVSFDDSQWSKVELPHSWLGAKPTAYYRGVGWYRKTLHIGPEAQKRRVFVRFGAVNQEADVYLNGTLLGRHEGGFTAFAFDLTPHLNFSGKNVLAVKVNNSANPNIAPISADFNFWGGIYRDVSLIVTRSIQITPLDFASSGVYITPSAVSKDSAHVSVKAKIRNESGNDATIDWTATILDANGKTVATQTSSLPIGSGERLSAVQEFDISNPHLWNGKKDPYLYRVVVRLLKGSQVIDEITEPMGLRYFRVDPEKGFFLNGKHLSLNGVNMHQDWRGKGWALGSEERKENIRILTELGANTIRLAHYPHAEETLDLLDRAGIVTWAEIPLVNKVMTTPDFARTTKQQLTELIRQQYNHPAIFFWSLFNEIEVDPGLVGDLNQLAHAEDPTRLTTGASNQWLDAFAKYPVDILGNNRYDGWYGGSIDRFGAKLDEIHSRLPKISLGVSEYGAGGSLIQHQDPPERPQPGGKFHPAEYQNLYHETYYAALKARPFIWGSYVWNLFDFAVAGRKEGDEDGMNDKGLMTYDRKTRKDVFYFYKAHWNPEPTLHITSRQFTERPSDTVDVKVYSNLNGLELQVNGVALPAPAQSNDVVFVWKGVKLKSGPNFIKVGAAREEKKIEDEVVWTAP